MVKLVISDNEGTTTVVPLVRDEISIGRKDGNTIRLTERNISRRHVRLERKNGGYHLHDLESYNGVTVNGRRVVGETQLDVGDQIQIGDYTMLVEADAKEAVPVIDELARTHVGPAPRSELPARLVTLLGPEPGRAYGLPERGEVRIGRIEELDIAFDHRSVSREHARLKSEGGEYRITDAGSANGVFVNGRRVEEALLATGDQIELGEVVLRFVAEGEAYTYDPADARGVVRSHRGGSRSGLMLAAAIVAGAVIVAFFILRGEELPPPPPRVAAVEATPAPQPATSVKASEPSAAEPRAQVDPKLVTACREAIQGGRFAEAMAHASAALKTMADDSAAVACEQEARALHEQEQTFVRGKAALEAGDLDAAHSELSSVPTEGVIASRPDVASTLEDLTQQLIAEARKQLRRSPETAARRAEQVTGLPGISAGLMAEANRIATQADEALRTNASRASHPARAARAERPRPSAPTVDPMEAASACLGRGDNACVIRALNGKARTAQELGLLIETYRAMGNSTAAYKNMAVYVRRFPTAKRSSAYQRMLERKE